jgi:hypothetical protein
MIRLDLKREPHWLDLGHGVRVHVRPCTTALMMAARAEVQRASLPPQNESEAAGERTAALVKALGRLGIQDWEGVGDAEGEPVPLRGRSGSRRCAHPTSPMPARSIVPFAKPRNSPAGRSPHSRVPAKEKARTWIRPGSACRTTPTSWSNAPPPRASI